MLKRILFTLIGLLFVTSTVLPQDSKSRTVSPSDSLTLTVKLSKDEKAVQNALLDNVAQTNTTLSESIEKLASVAQEGLELSKTSKLDKVATQMGTDRQTILKSFKRNGKLILISALPSLIFVFWAMGSFVLKKGLDVGKLLTGTAVMALYALIGSCVLYIVLTLIFNNQYFEIKSLLSTLF